MPIGKPDPDGEGVVAASRHYGGKPAPLGLATIWDCPACGKKNEGRLPDVGCGHCGAGDPSKSRAGKPGGPEPAAHPGRQNATRRAGRSAATSQVGNPGETLVEDPTDIRPATREELQQIAQHLRRPDAPRRVLRLIEYLIAPGQHADEVLRRSLVGRMDLAWGTLTGTIVDSIDANQEDRLRLARMQPGVWLGNSIMMQGVDARDREVPRPAKNWGVQAEAASRLPALPQEVVVDLPEIPDTGLAFSVVQKTIAQTILTVGGYKLVYTLALGLQQIAQDADSDPEKFLSSEECLQLASALMALIPPEWDEVAEQASAPPPPPTPLSGGTPNEAIERIKAGSVPTAVFREPAQREE